MHVRCSMGGIDELSASAIPASSARLCGTSGHTEDRVSAELSGTAGRNYSRLSGRRRYEASTWLGLAAPHGTPAEIIETLNREINAGLADAKIKAQLRELGHVPMPMSAAEFGKFIADETDKWGKVIQMAKIKVQ